MAARGVSAGHDVRMDAADQADRAQQQGRRAADSTALKAIARTGFVARGIVYVLIGAIALQIAFGHEGSNASRSGAIATLAGSTAGTALLWVVDVGFLGLAVWRLSEAAFGANEPDGDSAGHRLASLARAIVYAGLFWSVLQFLLGSSDQATQSGDSKSQGLTARLMGYPGGRIAVGVIGLAVIAIGVYLAREGWTRKFLERMDLHSASPRTRSVVEKLGLIGQIARGFVFAVIGIFAIVAAVRFNPQETKGMDGSLRTLANAPLGPVLLAVVAVGLVIFGLFAWTEARWRKV